MIPTGKGQKTQPGTHPIYSVYADDETGEYTLVIDPGRDRLTGKGIGPKVIWSINARGDSEFVGEIYGEYQPSRSERDLEDYWVDYVPLPVIQEIYSLVEPDESKELVYDEPHMEDKMENEWQDSFEVVDEQEDKYASEQLHAELKTFIKKLRDAEQELLSLNKKVQESDMTGYMKDRWKEFYEHFYEGLDPDIMRNLGKEL